MKIEMLAENYKKYWRRFKITGKTLLEFLKMKPESIELHDNRLVWCTRLFGLPTGEDNWQMILNDLAGVSESSEEEKKQ